MSSGKKQVAWRQLNSVTPDYRMGGRGDLYDRNMAIKWIVNLFIALYIIGYAMYGVLMVNVNPRYDWFSVPGAPCSELVSSRYNNVTYWAIAFSVFRIFFMVAIMAIIGFKRVVGCTTAWVAVMWLVVAIDSFVWVILLSNIVAANRPGHPTICDDPLKCNVREFYVNPKPNWCLNTEATPRSIDLTLDELGINEDCKWLFGANSAWLFIMDGILIGFTMIIWLGVTNWEQVGRFARKTTNSVMNAYGELRARAPLGARAPPPPESKREYRIPMPGTTTAISSALGSVSPEPSARVTAGGETKQRAAGLRVVESSKTK